MALDWQPDGPPFFDEAGRFRSVEAAATHAIIVQMGFTTCENEARRMLKEPQHKEMAERWLDAHIPEWR